MIYGCVSLPEVLSKGILSLEELRNITPLTSLGLLHKAVWALGNESADLHLHPLQWSLCNA